VTEVQPSAQALSAAVARLEQIAAGLAAGGDDADLERLAQEAMSVSEEITRLLPGALESEAD
jgi:hypothetical protein